MSAHRRVPVFVALAVVGATLWLSPPAAVGLSCAAAPDGTARSVVLGVEELWDERGFFELYDFAVAGTVTSVQAEGAGAANETTRKVEVDVINGYGIETIPEALVIAQGDYTGYSFEVSHTYFIPLLTVGPNGESNYSFLSDPISELSVTDAAELVALARPELVVAAPNHQDPPSTAAPANKPLTTEPVSTGPVSTGPVSTGPAPTDSEPPQSGGGALTGWIMAASAGVAGMVAATGAAQRRRRR